MSSVGTSVLFGLSPWRMTRLMVFITTVTGVTYDIGDYDAPLTEALRIAGYEELRAEQAARRERGDTRLLGIGLLLDTDISLAVPHCCLHQSFLQLLEHRERELRQSLPAVDDDRLTGDVAGFVGRQEQERDCDVFGIAQAL